MYNEVSQPILWYKFTDVHCTQDMLSSKAAGYCQIIASGCCIKWDGSGFSLSDFKGKAGSAWVPRHLASSCEIGHFQKNSVTHSQKENHMFHQVLANWERCDFFLSHIFASLSLSLFPHSFIEIELTYNIV